MSIPTLAWSLTSTSKNWSLGPHRFPKCVTDPSPSSLRDKHNSCLVHVISNKVKSQGANSWSIQVPVGGGDVGKWCQASSLPLFSHHGSTAMKNRSPLLKWQISFPDDSLCCSKARHCASEPEFAQARRTSRMRRMIDAPTYRSPRR